MQRLVEETGESVYLSVEGHRSTALYLDIVEGTHSVRHTSWVGRTIPLDRSAVGSVLLGHTPSKGYVVVERGIEADVTAIAAPIRSENRVVASMSLVIPSYRITDLDVAQYGRALVSAAAGVSAGLGRRTTTTSQGGEA
jgi:urocanate hydratase